MHARACTCNEVTVEGGWFLQRNDFSSCTDVSRFATPLYGIYFYIGKKCSRNREWGREGARERGMEGARNMVCRK